MASWPGTRYSIVGDGWWCWGEGSRDVAEKSQSQISCSVVDVQCSA